jgi:hypothetical protein
MEGSLEAHGIQGRSVTVQTAGSHVSGSYVSGPESEAEVEEERCFRASARKVCALWLLQREILSFLEFDDQISLSFMRRVGQRCGVLDLISQRAFKARQSIRKAQADDVVNDEDDDEDGAHTSPASKRLRLGAMGSGSDAVCAREKPLADQREAILTTSSTPVVVHNVNATATPAEAERESNTVNNPLWPCLLTLPAFIGFNHQQRAEALQKWMTEANNATVATHADTMSTTLLARFFRRAETYVRKVKQQIAREVLEHFTASADHKNLRWKESPFRTLAG